MRLIHLTDLHLSHLDGVKFKQLRGKRWSGFVSWHKNRRKKYLPRVLEQLCRAVQAENADQIMVTGDLVQIGMAAEIEMAADWLHSLGTPEQVMLVPGNHDVYARDSEKDVMRWWGDYLFQGQAVDANSNAESAKPVLYGQWPVVRQHGPLTLIGLSTANVSPVFMASGKLDETQLQALPGLLQQARAAGQLVAILIHHPPLPGMTGYRKSLVNAADLEAILADQPPDLMFYGHLHRNRETLWHDARIYCTSAASSVADAAYRIIDLEDSGDQFSLTMQLKTIDADARGLPCFVVIDEASWTIPKRPI